MDNESILRTIEELMEQRGYTRYKLAQLSGIKQSTLTTMLNKRSTISIENLSKISAAFGFPLSELIRLVEHNPAPSDAMDFPTLVWEQLPPAERELLKKILLAYVGMNEKM